MSYAVALACLSVAFLGAVVTTPLVRRLALQRGWVDAPDGQRKLHRDPTPALGGVGIAVGLAGGLGGLLFVSQAFPGVELLVPTVWGGALVIFASGLYDDVRGLGFKGKLLVQVAVAYALLHAGYRVDVTGLPLLGDLDPYDQALYAIPLTVLWVVGVINAVNLIDGLDGLAGGVSFIASAALAFVAGLHGEVGLMLLGLVVCGATAGFLVYNVRPASIFMGDSGSLLLGYLLSVFALAGTAGVAAPHLLLVPVVALGLPLLDAALSMIRRLRSGQAVCAPDHDHIHHRLVRRGSPGYAVLVLYGVSTVLALAAVAISVTTPLVAAGVVAVVALAAGVKLAWLGYFEETKATDASSESVVAEQHSYRAVLPGVGNSLGGDGRMGLPPAVGALEGRGETEVREYAEAADRTLGMETV